MAFIIPVGWTRKEGFPNIQGNDDGVTLVDAFYCAYDLTDISLKMPKSNSLYDGEAIIKDLAELRLSSYQIEPTSTKNHANITLNYQPSDANIAPEEDIESYFLDVGTLEKALEKHADYLSMWNYDLWEFIKTTNSASSLPAWSITATDKSDATGQAKENEYAWDQDKPSGGYVKGSDVYDWIKVQDRTKPGVESFIVPSPLVQERVHYRSKKKANQAGADVGKLEAPEEVFGISGGEWLIMSGSVQKDGRRYLVERSFQFADDWDGDLYADS